MISANVEESGIWKDQENIQILHEIFEETE